MREVVRYLWRMTPAVLLGLALYLCVYPLRMGRLRGLGYTSRRGREWTLAVFLMFLAGLLWLTVLPEILWENGRVILREEGFGKINLRPFMIFTHSRILAARGNHSYFLINFWGNILMFVPIGFFPALLWRKGTWWKALLMGGCLSLIIELCQIPISRGTDIDDLWLNTLGTLLGYWVYRLFDKGFPAFSSGCKIREG